MKGRFASIILLMAALATAACALWAAEPSPGAPMQAKSATSLLVLRNGEVLSGRVSRQGDRYIVVSEGTEIRLAIPEVDFLCQTIDEAYTVQRNRIVAGRIEDHLNLAEWCLRQQLLGDAAREIAAAMQIDAKNPRVALLDSRLQRALHPEPLKATAANNNATAPRPVSTDELERLVRSLPSSTVETFTSNIQPMLLNYCATAGCHGPSSSSSYTLSRAPLEKIAARRLTERNLYNTLQWIDRESPLDSKLLTAARQPHGPEHESGDTGVDTAKYQELVNWVLQSNPSYAINPKPPVTVSAAATLSGGAPPILASPSPASLLVPDSASQVDKGTLARIHKKPSAEASTVKSPAKAADVSSGSSLTPPISETPPSSR
jgi:hypothetical protein